MIGVIVASPTSSAPPASARSHPPAEVRLLEIPVAVDSRKHPNPLPPHQPQARRRWSRLPATGSCMPKRSRPPNAFCAPASQHQNRAGLSTLSIVAVDGWMKPKAVACSSRRGRVGLPMARSTLWHGRLGQSAISGRSITRSPAAMHPARASGISRTKGRHCLRPSAPYRTRKPAQTDTHQAGGCQCFSA